MKIGVLGAGQLARMLAFAAHQLGIEIICVDPSPECSAQNVTQVHQADYSDIQKMATYFSGVDCVTYETENLPIEAVKAIDQKFKLFPTLAALELFQDRLSEKNFLNSLSIPTVDYRAVNTWSDIENAIRQFAFPFVMKTRLSGYDGKGQAIIRNLEEAELAWERLSRYPLIIEKFANFDYEVSIIAVRSSAGKILFYPIVFNEHRNGILFLSKAPYVNEVIELAAKNYATQILQKLNYVGVMTVEFFCQNNQLLVNEIAPRVHNSGHWTIEGAETSQFENHLRAISGLPLGSTKPIGHAAMINFIGKHQNMSNLLSIPGAHYHWYNKEVRQGRKLGHLTLCAASENEMQVKLDKALASVAG